jgi:hypothetical protein
VDPGTLTTISKRHVLWAREREIEPANREQPRPSQKVLTARQVMPLDKRTELPRPPPPLPTAPATRTSGPPSPRRLTQPGVILVDAQRPPTKSNTPPFANQSLSTPSTTPNSVHHPQLRPPPPTPPTTPNSAHHPIDHPPLSPKRTTGLQTFATGFPGGFQSRTHALGGDAPPMMAETYQADCPSMQQPVPTPSRSESDAETGPAGCRNRWPAGP